MPTQHKPTTPPRTRSKAEELALRRSQLARRQKRLAARAASSAEDSQLSDVSALDRSMMSAASTPPGANGSPSRPPPTPEMRPYPGAEEAPPPIPAVLEAKKRAARMAKDELQLEKDARAVAEQRAAEMALKALESEREAREQAEERLRVEQKVSHDLHAAKGGKKESRIAAAVTIQKMWRGWWIRKLLSDGMEELNAPIRKVQAMWRAAKVRKAVRLAVRQNRERLEHHVCIHKTTATLRPTRVLRLVEFAEPKSAGPLGLNFDDDLRVAEPVGERAAAAGVIAGMQLVLFQGEPMEGRSVEDVHPLFAATARPWKMSFQTPDGYLHEGRTLRSMVDALRSELGHRGQHIEASLPIIATVDRAVEITGVPDVHRTLYAKACAVCHHLDIDTENEPIKPLTLSGCLKSEFNGDYVFVGEANGRPHWRQPTTDGRHLYWGSNGMWLLRKTFQVDNAQATAFYEPPEPDGEEPAAEERGEMSVVAPLGHTEWMWYDTKTKEWQHSLVLIETSSEYYGTSSLPRSAPEGPGRAGARQLEFGDEAAGGAEQASEDSDEPSSLPPPAVTRKVRCFVEDKAKWDRVIKAAQAFLARPPGRIVDVKCHINGANQCVVMVMYEEGGGDQNYGDFLLVAIKNQNAADRALDAVVDSARTVAGGRNRAGKPIPDREVWDQKPECGLISSSLSPANVSDSGKKLQGLVCTGAPPRLDGA